MHGGIIILVRYIDACPCPGFTETIDIKLLIRNINLVVRNKIYISLHERCKMDVTAAQIVTCTFTIITSGIFLFV